MEFNWLDAVIGGVLFISVLGAATNGVTKEILRIASLAVGLFMAMWWYDTVAVELQQLVDHPKLAAGLAFVLILVACLTFGTVFSWVLVKLWKITGLRWFDRALGGAFGLVRGLLVAAVVLMTMVSFSPFPGTARVVADSRLAPWVMSGAQLMASVAPHDFQDAFANGFDSVQAAWIGDSR